MLGEMARKANNSLDAVVQPPAEVGCGINSHVSAALDRNVLRARKPHEVPNGEKIRLVVEITDQFELVLKLLTNLGWDAVGVTLGSTLPSKLREKVEWRLAFRGKFRRILVAQLIE